MHTAGLSSKHRTFISPKHSGVQTSCGSKHDSLIDVEYGLLFYITFQTAVHLIWLLLVEHSL